MTDYPPTGAPVGWQPPNPNDPDYPSYPDYHANPSYPGHSQPGAEAPRSMPAKAADEARNVAGKAADETKSVARTAADEARGVAQDARSEMHRLVGDARSQLRSQVSEQSDRLVGSLQDVGHQLRTMAEKADDPESPVTNLTRQAADSAERFASRLQDGGFDDVIGDVKRFARNRPGLFLAGALAAGLIVGRIAKAVDIGEVVKGDQSQQGDGRGQPSAEAMTDPYQPYATSRPAYPVPETTQYPVAEHAGYPGTEGTRPEQWDR